MELVIGGIYEHYKKKQYRVLAIAKHTETLEKLVVYQALYDDGSVWVRPLSMFLEDVIIDGASRPRFSYIEA